MARGDDFFLLAFNLLSTERSFPGKGFGPIPHSKAWDYAARMGYAGDFCCFFAQVIVILDGHYRENIRKTNEKEDQKERRRQRREERANRGTAPKRTRSRK